MNETFIPVVEKDFLSDATDAGEENPVQEQVQTDEETGVES